MNAEPSFTIGMLVLGIGGLVVGFKLQRYYVRKNAPWADDYLPRWVFDEYVPAWVKGLTSLALLALIVGMVCLIGHCRAS